ncbi:hypothetical protein M427DRAFT_325686 [Gonapodya prolifera JEL478]|uniref:Uncharacterized protein n=1 Tax=Gonapodya prolifera (strain JEL478) TaxID=1344416 RepID=A0A139AFJ6_GONPJ|nr:hypothetical protein M427DRAFT_325686 [Gonapodya prolifera JEL478]|eukprot:KXS15469.1 hypothetical protein M427DRAFT_325686 [Gonapodya prolifera JEL478]
MSEFQVNQSSYGFFEYPLLDRQPTSRFPPYEWIDGAGASNTSYRSKYIDHLDRVLGLPRHGDIKIFDSSQHNTLLTGELGNYTVEGTTDLLATWDGATVEGDPCVDWRGRPSARLRPMSVRSVLR